jgi:hypothetical protein
MNEAPKDNLTEIRATLQHASDIILALRTHLSGLSVDTIFALGEATGTLVKAKGLVERDIADRKRKAQ